MPCIHTIVGSIAAALAVLGALCCGKDYGEALRSGELWEMSPGEVWKAFFQQDKNVYSIHTSILLPGREQHPGEEIYPGEAPLPRSYWYWTPGATAREWANGWNLARFATTPQRLALLGKCSSMRVKRVSSMLYRAGSDKPEAARDPAAYAEQLSAWCGVPAQPLTDRHDAAGRSIAATLWEMEKSVALLESATVQGEPDYIRLTFAPTWKDLFYKRTSRPEARSRVELYANVRHGEKNMWLEDFPCFTHLSISSEHAYAPGWFAVLCYYGYHDLDNYSTNRQKNKYPGKYTEVKLRSKHHSRKLYTGFLRSYKKQENLKYIEQPEAEGIYVLDNYVEKADRWWKSMTDCLEDGLPVIYGGSKAGHVIIGYRERPGERYATSTLHGEMSAERCYMQPNGIYTILPEDNTAEAPTDTTP